MVKMVLLSIFLLGTEAAATEAQNWWAPLLNTGPIGAILVWFMLRNEPRLRAIEASIDRIARALMIVVTAMKMLDKALVDEAQQILDEVKNKTPPPP